MLNQRANEGTRIGAKHNCDAANSTDKHTQRVLEANSSVDNISQFDYIPIIRRAV